MKILLLAVVASMLFLGPAFAQLSDKTGLRQHFEIQTGGYEFDVGATTNFDVTNYEFDKDEKRLTLFINSGLENNLAEIEIPKNLINGNFTFFLNEQEIFPKIRGNEKISFIVLEFPGTGVHKLDIIGTTYLPEFSDIAPLVLATSLAGIIFLVRKRLIIR
jgi:hypothetical protein